MFNYSIGILKHIYAYGISMYKHINLPHKSMVLENLHNAED